MLEITGLTPEFVSIEAWEGAVRAIREHADFSHRVVTVLTIQGEAGVGKTRCTYEALSQQAAQHALLTYTSDHRIPVHRPVTGDGAGNGKGPEAEGHTLPRAAGADLERQVREWYHSIVPRDLHGRLVGLIGQDPWHQQPAYWRQRDEEMVGP